MGHQSVLIPTTFINPNITKHASCKFYVFSFHDDFDLLLGWDNLEQLGAILDIKQKCMKIDKVKIPIQFHPVPQCYSKRSIKKNEGKLITIPPRSGKQIQVHVTNVKNGNAIIDHMKAGPIEIPNCMVEVINHQAYCIAINTSESTEKLKVGKLTSSEPIETHMLQNKLQINNFNLNKKTQKLRNILPTIRQDHLNAEEKGEIMKLIRDYADIFYDPNETLGTTNLTEHEIKTTDEVPVYSKSYRYPEIYRTEVKEQIHKMIKDDIIQPSNSPYNSPLWIVPKKDDASGKKKFRIVIDYRALNQKTIDDKYNLPNIEDILSKLGKCKYFTTLDLASGFHQVKMKPESIPKTAFSSDNGKWEFKKMPFGLKNAPSTFQRLMDNCLRGIQNEICAVYMDDIIVFSSSLQEHIGRLRTIFDRLRQANLKVQLDKTEFLRKEVAFLGHLITPDGLKPNPKKVEAIKNFPLPKNTKELKGFLGLLSYYRKFIKNLADLTKPLTLRLKKGNSIKTDDDEYMKCFEKCKDLLINDPVLKYPDFTKPFILNTDASGVALGAVLSQKFGNEIHPIAYASRTLNDTERKLSTIERELLACVWACQYFRPYLYGRKFTLETDHQPLQWLHSLKEPNSKLFRWKLRLEEFNFDIKYRKGKHNNNADALSRIELHMKENEPLNNETSPSLIVNLDEDEDDIETLHSDKEGKNLTVIPIKEEPVNHSKNQIIINIGEQFNTETCVTELFNGNKVKIEVKFPKRNLENEIKNFLLEHIRPKISYGLYFESDIYTTFVNVVMTTFKSPEIKMTKHTRKLLDVEDREDQINIINYNHRQERFHRGIDETYQHIKRTYFWPRLKEDITNIINTCELCLKCKYERKPLKPALNITPTPTTPFEIIHADTFTVERQKFLMIIDKFSKYAQAYPLKSLNAIDITRKLMTFISHHGTPREIIMDNGNEFSSSTVKEFLKLQKVKIHYISTQNPNSNSPVERLHSTLIEILRLMNESTEFRHTTIREKFKYAIITYNSSIHSSTGMTPYEIINGTLASDSPIPDDIEIALTNTYVSEHKDKMRKLYKILHEKQLINKEKTINKINENREENLPEFPSQILVETKQIQDKTKRKYNVETLQEVNPKLKTALITPRHHNTRPKIHTKNIKRPRAVTTEKTPAEEKENKTDQTQENVTSRRTPGIKLSDEDIETTTGTNWYNDQIINAFMELINHRSEINPELPKTYAFNVFLYISYLKGYNRVKNYTKKINIMEKDLILIPIHKDNHWRLISIEPQHKIINYYDSLSLPGQDILDNIFEYLKTDCENKLNIQLDKSEWDLRTINVPQQKNTYDCGPFMCKIADLLSQDYPVTFDPLTVRDEINHTISLRDEILNLTKTTLLSWKGLTKNP